MHCDTGYVNTSTHLCCSGVVHRLTAAGARCCGQQLQTAGMRCCRNATTAQLYNESQQCCGGQLLLLLTGVVLKKKWGTPETRLRQRFLKQFRPTYTYTHIRQKNCHSGLSKFLIRHHDHPARVHYWCVTVTGIWTVLCILSVTWPMMMQTRTSIIRLLLYTLQFIFLSSHASLHSTLSARSPSLSLPLPHFRGLRSVPLQPISSGLRPQAPPRFRDASSSGTGPILVTTTADLWSCPAIQLLVFECL